MEKKKIRSQIEAVPQHKTTLKSLHLILGLRHPPHSSFAPSFVIPTQCHTHLLLLVKFNLSHENANVMGWFCIQRILLEGYYFLGKLLQMRAQTLFQKPVSNRVHVCAFVCEEAKRGISAAKGGRETNETFIGNMIIKTDLLYSREQAILEMCAEDKSSPGMFGSVILCV